MSKQGALEMTRVPRIDDAHARAQRHHHPLGDGDVLRVSAASEQQRSCSYLVQSIPVRRLRPLAQHAELVGEALDAVRVPPFLESGHRRWERREHRLREPALEECFNAITLDVARELVVDCTSSRAFGRVRNAGRRADQNQPVDEIRPVESELQAESTTHRVPDVRGLPAEVADRRCGRREVEPVGYVEGQRFDGRVANEPPIRGRQDAAV